MTAIAPIFVLDSHELWRPVGVEESLRTAGLDVAKSLVDPLCIDFPSKLKPAKLPFVGYWRVVRGDVPWWHQFWLWYPHNPKNYVVKGEHEGDWEVVQVGTIGKDGSGPVLISCSRHQAGGKREYWAAEQHEGRAVIYVARDSHAHYFAPMNNLEDQADGKGAVLDTIEWRRFGAWATYKGRWGNSDTSPVSPGRQFVWGSPHLWHGQAK
jgi:hypothetical protein